MQWVTSVLTGGIIVAWAGMVLHTQIEDYNVVSIEMLIQNITDVVKASLTVAVVVVYGLAGVQVLAVLLMALCLLAVAVLTGTAVVIAVHDATVVLPACVALDIGYLLPQDPDRPNLRLTEWGFGRPSLKEFYFGLTEGDIS